MKLDYPLLKKLELVTKLTSEKAQLCLFLIICLKMYASFSNPLHTVTHTKMLQFFKYLSNSVSNYDIRPSHVYLITPTNILLCNEISGKVSWNI